VAVLMNAAFCALFLLRETVPQAQIAAKDAEERQGRVSFNSAEPYLIATREVPAHGGETPGVQLYGVVSLPGIMAGFMLNDLVWDALGWVADPWLFQTEWMWQTKGRSWVLAAAMLVGTSLWWVFVGWMVGYIVERSRARRSSGAAASRPTKG
jgi:hypothetical protein